MKTIAIGNNKGGVGKTVTAVSLAAALRIVFNKRVLLVDCDPQGNATKYLLGKDYELDQHLGSALINQDFEDVILETPAGLDIAPADVRLGNSTEVIEDLKQWRYRLKNTLATLKDHYDFIIIDCPPSLKTFTVMALVAADAYLIPTEPEEFAVDGLDKITRLADGVVEALNPKLQLLGIVVTRYHKNLRNAHHDKMMNFMREKYGENNMLPTVRRDKTVLDSIENSTTIFHENQDSNVVKDYTAIAAAILERV